MCVLAMLCGALSARDIKTVEATYVYHASLDISIRQARAIALERARLQAIADEFGTIVVQTNITEVKNKNGNSSIDFLSLGGTEVKGEWLEDIGEPEYLEDYSQEYREKGFFVVTCHVKGHAREIKAATVDFRARVLNDDTNPESDKDATLDFRSGEKFYLSFRSPVNGYVAVYLLDADSAYCLLPDRHDEDGMVQVKRDKNYCFFSQKAAPKEQKVDEYVLTCQKEMEVNHLYVLFSPQRFSKALDNVGGVSKKTKLLMPNYLSIEKFQNWLTKNRIKDEEMRMEIKKLTVRRKE